MSYTECPRCHRIAKEHGMIISKEIGNPIITCRTCNKMLADDNIYEWHAISKISQLSYCIFSNYRIVLHSFILILIVQFENFYTSFICFVIIELILCTLLYFCVTTFNALEISDSFKRVQNPDHVDTLARLGYDKLDRVLYDEYLDRKELRTKHENETSNMLFNVIEDCISSDCNFIDSAETHDESSSLINEMISSIEVRESELTDSEKLQCALDRWMKRYKSDWDIGIEYERYVGYCLECRGYKVNYSGATKGLNDMGRDLLATKNGKTLVIQCKRWSQEKILHEKHVFQLHGSTAVLAAENPAQLYKAVFITTARLSDVAKKCANACDVAYVEGFSMSEYPLIKCNANKDGEKIYHLPFDPQYDKVIMFKNKKSCYVWTIEEAERLGFRHTHNSKL